jgi:hypothetical protein
LTSIFLRKDIQEEVCKGPIVERFADGPIGIVGNKLYEWTGTAYVLSGADWYRMLTLSTAYEWDGNDWTGNSTAC